MSTIHCSSEVDACSRRLSVGSATLTIVLSIATSRTLRHRTARIHQRRAWVFVEEVMRLPRVDGGEETVKMRHRPGARDEPADVGAQPWQLRALGGAHVRRDGDRAERSPQLP